MPRALPEWIATHPDQAIPPRVKLRIFEAHDGVCHLTGRKIRAGQAWECDHIIALACGGAHRESNLAPALKDAHRLKTTDDQALKSKIARQRAKHLGVFPPSPFKLKGRGFPRRREPA